MVKTNMLAGFALAIVDLALPARCLKCGEILGRGAAALCAPCWSALRWIGEPYCSCCGTPFEYASEAGGLCGACLAEPPSFSRARAALAYDGQSRDLVLRFKHGDRTDAAPFLAAMMARAGEALLREADAIVPVPLHWRRLWRRRYNQAAMLAGELARQSNKPLLVDALVRRRATPSQGHLGRKARKANVAGAFVAAPSRMAPLRGRHVLLVDDVLTTGATVEAGAKALLLAGASQVDVLALARVLGEQ